MQQKIRSQLSSFREEKRATRQGIQVLLRCLRKTPLLREWLSQKDPEHRRAMRPLHRFR